MDRRTRNAAAIFVALVLAGLLAACGLTDLDRSGQCFASPQDSLPPTAPADTSAVDWWCSEDE